MQTSKYTLLIICEGEKTEPLFFYSIRDKILNGTFNIGNVVINIRPEPNIPEEVDEQLSPHKAPRKKIPLRKTINADEPVIEGVPPLKWVLHGQEELRNGIHNEVWVVFDHDNHPKRREAFEKAEEEINGNKVRIAFSSRSFEYYMLLHFEPIYYMFEKTDCKREKDKIVGCGGKNIADDCNGTICINGYARRKKYWDDSRDEVSIFPTIIGRLGIGFENSIWLRMQSDINENGVEIYNRNPYTNVDILVQRLTNTSLSFVDYGEPFRMNDIQIELNQDKIFTIRNIGNDALIIQKNSFCKVTVNTGERIDFGDRAIIYPQNQEGYPTQIEIDLKEIFENGCYYIFSYEGKAAMFG